LSNGIPFSARAEHTPEPYRQVNAGWTNITAGWSNAAWMETVNLGKPTLLMAHTHGGLGLRVSSTFNDAAGKRVEGNLNSYLGNPDVNGRRRSAIHSFVQPDLTAGMTNLSLEIIVQRLREIDFYARPPTNFTWMGKPPG